jgi:hypothetical protein
VTLRLCVERSFIRAIREIRGSLPLVAAGRAVIFCGNSASVAAGRAVIFCGNSASVAAARAGKSVVVFFWLRHQPRAELARIITNFQGGLITGGTGNWAKVYF